MNKTQGRKLFRKKGASSSICGTLVKNLASRVTVCSRYSTQSFKDSVTECLETRLLFLTAHFLLDNHMSWHFTQQTHPPLQHTTVMKTTVTLDFLLSLCFTFTKNPYGLFGMSKRRWGKREIIYLFLQCHHQNDSCIKKGSDESHFNISLTVRDKVTMSTNHNLFEEKGELKWN